MRLTISTDGEHRGAPVHDVEDIAAGSYYGGDYARHTAVVTLDAGQAMALASDLLYQLVDAGVLSGWNVQFPESGVKYPYGGTRIENES